MVCLHYSYTINVLLLHTYNHNVWLIRSSSLYNLYSSQRMFMCFLFQFNSDGKFRTFLDGLKLFQLSLQSFLRTLRHVGALMTGNSTMSAIRWHWHQAPMTWFETKSVKGSNRWFFNRFVVPPAAAVSIPDFSAVRRYHLKRQKECIVYACSHFVLSGFCNYSQFYWKCARVY